MGIETNTSKKMTVASMLSVGAVVTVLSASAFARGPVPPPPPFPLTIDAYTAVVDLDAAQVDKLKAILKDARAKQNELHDNFIEARSAKRAEMDALRDRTDAAIAKILNEDQRAKLADEYRSSDRGRGRFPGWMHNWRGDRDGDRFDRRGMMNRWDDDKDDDSYYCDGPYSGNPRGYYGRGGCR